MARKNAYSTFAKSTSETAQTSPILGRETEMAKNNAGGYTFTLTPMARLERFLILGSDGNTYYQSSKEITEGNARSLIPLIQSDGVTVVNKIVEISDAGRAPKNDPALFALSLVMTYGNDAAKRAAYEAVGKVARIGTHILHLADYVNGLRGWGRGVRRAFGNWYLNQTPKGLAMNLVKYANRDGWTHRDVLRLAHPTASGEHNALLAFAAGKEASFGEDEVGLFMSAVAEIKSTDSAKVAARLITTHRLPREVVPTQLLNERVVWEALLPHMGSTALIRNIATLQRVGLLDEATATERDVMARLVDVDRLKKDRVHPIQMLSAVTVYNRGAGVRGTNTWTPNARISGALEDGFYASFNAVRPSGKRFLLGLDVSGSMTWGEIAGVPGLNPAIASTVMAMVTARTEPDCVVKGFADSFRDLGITKNDTLQTAIRKTHNQNFGGTDCSLPMTHALEKKMEIDTFVVYTDNETYAGRIQPSQALVKYRNATGINARLVVVGMTATGFTIADPKDAGMLDVVGFDSAAPTVISSFARGDF